MKTKEIKIYYKIERSKISPISKSSLDRKNLWIKEVSKATYKSPMLVEVIYRLTNPEVERQRKFFNGPVVEYFGIQNDHLLEGELSTTRKRIYREQILDEILGYDIELIDKKVRRRKSTADYINTQRWHDFLETVKETLFDPSGYEFPESEEFWKLSQNTGFDQARKISIEKLQARIKAKSELSTGEELKSVV